MSDEPLVSIVMPVYNRAAKAREAIASALEAAPKVPLEVVVVDDGSTDDTWSALESIGDLRVRVLRMERNSGQSAARNRGLDVACGRYVKFLDSDDLLIAEHLPLEVEALGTSGADIGVSGWAESGPGGQTKSTEAPRFTSIIDDVLAGLGVPTSSALYVRHPDWRWDPSLRKLDDWDYFCQAALGATRIVTVPGPAYVWRHHAGERATNVTMLANAREHHRILEKIETRLKNAGTLTPVRSRRLAQYYYKELRVLSLNDPPAADAALDHIFTLDPSFLPRDEEQQPLIRLSARVIGVGNTIRLYRVVSTLLAGIRARRAY